MKGGYRQSRGDRGRPTSTDSEWQSPHHSALPRRQSPTCSSPTCCCRWSASCYSSCRRRRTLPRLRRPPPDSESPRSDLCGERLSSPTVTDLPYRCTNVFPRLKSINHRVKYIFYLEPIRPIRIAENFEAVEWATGFSNKHGCIVGL